AQAIEQIARLTLFASSALARGSRGSRVRLLPFIEQTEKLRFPIHDFLWVQTPFAQRTRLLSGLLHIQQQAFEVVCPDEALLCQKDQIAQDVQQTERMLTVVQEVRAPSIVDGDAHEMCQDPDGFQGRVPSTLLDVIVGESRCARNVHPVAM